eukprot:XP_011662419.1 PREDICTED: probable phosphorylase b kinase regulatory subunit beta [Strongylocentrotus purpuratus]
MAVSEVSYVQALAFLGQNKKLGLTGRPNRPIGIIGTSKIYRLLGRTVICYPLQFDLMDFYMYQDINFLVDDIKSLVAFVRKSWNYAGRPTLCLVIREEHFITVPISPWIRLAEIYCPVDLAPPLESLDHRPVDTTRPFTGLYFTTVFYQPLYRRVPPAD